MKRLLLSMLVGAAFAGCAAKTQNINNTGGNTSGNNGGNNGGNGGGTGTDVLLGSSTATTLLVDNEWASSAGVPNTTTPSYELFTGLMNAANFNYDTIVDVTDGNPTYADLQLFDSVIWFSAYTYNPSGGVDFSVSPEQLQILTTWLDLGGKTLILYTCNLIYDIGTKNWNGPETNTFLTNYLGVVGDAADMSSDVNGSLNHGSYTLTGAGPFTGDTWSIAANTPISDTADGVNVSAGTDILATVQADPDSAGSDIANVPVVVGRKNVGAKGTSTVVFVGTTIEDITPLVYTNADIFNGLLTYAGI